MEGVFPHDVGQAGVVEAVAVGRHQNFDVRAVKRRMGLHEGADVVRTRSERTGARQQIAQAVFDDAPASELRVYAQWAVERVVHHQQAVFQKVGADARRIMDHRDAEAL
ncbi:hypothetical protein D3C73_1159090 [compost metagenome]